LIPEDWYFWTHRRSIALAAKSDGFDVTIATRVHNHGSAIKDAGFKLIPIRLRRGSRNPIQELLAIKDLISIYRRERPSIVHHVTIKSVLYGTLAAWIAQVPAVVNAIAGLGHVFVERGWRASVFRRLIILAYRIILNKKNMKVIVQNPDDMKTIIDAGIVSPEKIVLIRGAGVHLDEFFYQPESDGIPVVMMAGRLLSNKGVNDLVEAGRLLRSKNIACRIVLAGLPDGENPKAISEETLKTWNRNNEIEWWGQRENMPEVLTQSSIVVLPTTYGEGIPKVLIEAAASGRPIVATDVPGCREIVRHEVNGLLVPPGNVQLLSEALSRLINDPNLRKRMGVNGREIAEKHFSEEKVVTQTLSVYKGLVS
jgi:glycosyltransferase involved in cell wall biosynthesis